MTKDHADLIVELKDIDEFWQMAQERDALRKQLDIAKFKLNRIYYHSYDVDESPESIAEDALAEIEKAAANNEIHIDTLRGE